MAQEKNVIKYGTKGYTFDLRWRDEAKRDELVVVDARKTQEIMNARAKGTSVYDLINTYGGIDEVTAAFSEGGVYGDFSDVPEMCNDEAYAPAIARLQAELDALKAQAANGGSVEVPPVTEEVESSEGENDEK